MMDELVQTVSQKTGLSPDQARSAIDAVLNFLKQRLPAPLASHLDGMLGGGAAATEGSTEGGGESLASEATAVLGSFFSKKTES